MSVKPKKASKIMDITKKAKEEFEDRINRIEDFIADRGVGSTYLRKAKTTQRNINLALVVGGLITVAGLTMWAMSGDDED